MSCCGGTTSQNKSRVPSTGSAGNQTFSSGGSGSSTTFGMTKSGFCMKCFSFWLFVGIAVLVIWELGKEK